MTSLMNGDGVRIFVYGMQSSGTTLLALLLAQQPGRLGVLDLWIPYTAPALDDLGDVVLKATVSETPIASHIESFKPDRTVLNLRHPADIVSSLATKSYRDFGGTLQHKLSTLERMFLDRDRFDLVIKHEALLSDPETILQMHREVGIKVPSNAYQFARSVENVLSHALESSDWCANNFRKQWGLGNVRHSALRPPRPSVYELSTWAHSLASAHCPTLLDSYDR